MVNPLYLIAVFLLGAFLIALTDKIHRYFSIGLMLLVLAYAVEVSVIRLWGTINYPTLSNDYFTAGFNVPLSIALRFGVTEAFLLTLINLGGLFGALYLMKNFLKGSVQSISLFMLILLGANGLVLTRDIFNTFVFLEILSIATYASIGIKESKAALSAGIKYMLASGLASSFFLVGVIFSYKYTGTLNIDTWIATPMIATPGYIVALFLVSIGIFIELKPFPANGWALDLYQSVHSGIGSVISTINTGALIYVFYKLLPLMPMNMLYLFAGAGFISFIFANLTALRQKDAKRLLGYSSTAQTGLMVFAITALTALQVQSQLIMLIVGGLFVTNFIAKSGLFWLSGLLKDNRLSNWTSLRRDKGLVVIFALFVFALAGFPPFPSFYAKWELMKILAGSQMWVWMGGLLLGSLLEVIYMLRWFGMVVKGDDAVEEIRDVSFSHRLPLLTGSFLMLTSAGLMGSYLMELPVLSILPFIGLLLFWVLDFLPIKLKGLLSIAALSAWGWYVLWGQLNGINQLFGLMLVGAAIIQLFSFMRHKTKQRGLYPLLVMLIMSMGNLLIAKSNLEFFIAWEFMTITSYLLILRGKQSKEPALSYISFSMGGAYLILSGLVILPSLFGGDLLSQVHLLTGAHQIALISLGIGFLVKIGALGVHVWLPGAYAEAETEFTGFMSSVLSKAGIFGIVILLLFAKDMLSNSSLLVILGWIGALTAFFGALMAVFQEDVKKLLAYSSMSQLGYIILSLAMMTHLGWVSGMYMAVNHLLFKALVFTAIAAVILRTGTRNMYEMGGLIKKMPIAYVSVLMGIIAASGVPPLTGFGSKWFIYTSLIEKGWYLQAGLAFFASAIAFLYLYKLIHTVFLGQLKPEHSKIKEAPIWMILPQGIFIMIIMAFSLFPNMLTKPLSDWVAQYIARPEWLTWTGYNIDIASPVLHASWNGNLVMLVTMGVFGFVTAWLLLVNAKAQKVKQFNIVFAAERPDKPWTTHFAHNMFSHYRKALGFLIEPKITAFWNGTAEWTHSLSATISRLYTGNGQTYLLHIILYTLTLYWIAGVK